MLSQRPSSAPRDLGALATFHSSWHGRRQPPTSGLGLARFLAGSSNRFEFVLLCGAYSGCAEMARRRSIGGF